MGAYLMADGRAASPGQRAYAVPGRSDSVRPFFIKMLEEGAGSESGRPPCDTVRQEERQE